MEEFMIGETFETMENLEELSTPVTPPKSEYYPYAGTVNKGNGGRRGVGSPRAVWIFGVFTLEERDQLKTFCPDASGTVYIRTKLNDDTYADFQATMLWVENEPRWYGHKQNYQIVFRNLVMIEEGS